MSMFSNGPQCFMNGRDAAGGGPATENFTEVDGAEAAGLQPERRKRRLLVDFQICM